MSQSATRLPAPRRRRQLLDIALGLFATGGFHATSMNDIAEAAGVTKPILYQHFDSKRELYRELVTDVGTQLEREIVAATSAEPNGRQQVEAGCRAYFEFVADHEHAFQVLIGGATRRDEEFAAEAEKVEASLAGMIGALITIEGLDVEHRRLLGRGIVGLAEGASRHWLASGRRPDAETLAAQVAELAWAGLRGIDGG